MSFEAFTSHATSTKPNTATALVLMGGGARTAYQTGVLHTIARMLRKSSQCAENHFPFPILLGTSAGALNAAYLGCRANKGLAAFDELTEFWTTLRSSQIYQLKVTTWIRSSRLIAALFLSQQVRSQQAFLNNTPLVDTLHRIISLEGVEQALQSGALKTLAVTASSYTSGVHWTFCHDADNSPSKNWKHPGRRAEFQPITIEHLVASSALPFIFPATPLWVDGHREFFGDGSMRQTSPLSAALRLDASKILVIGVGQPERAGLINTPAIQAGDRPTLGMIAGHALASVFQDTLQADVEQARRVNDTLRQMPPQVAAHLPYRPVDVLAISPSKSLDAIAQSHAAELPSGTYNALEGLGALGSRKSPGGAALASYLLFAPGFIKALMHLGEQDAMERESEILTFFADNR